MLQQQPVQARLQHDAILAALLKEAKQEQLRAPRWNRTWWFRDFKLQYSYERAWGVEFYKFLFFYPHRAVEVPWAFTNVAQLGTRIAKMKKSKFRWNCGEFTHYFGKTYICFKSSLFCNCLLVSFSLYLFFSQRALLEPGLKLVITLH